MLSLSTELVGLPQGPLSLAPTGETVFNAPDLSTPLTFTARGSDGSVSSRTIQLRVKPRPVTPGPSGGTAVTPPVTPPAPAPQPVIKRFDVTRPRIKQGESTQLRWTVSGVDQVKIFPDGTVFQPNSNTLLRPQVTTTYTLVAGTQRQQVTVEVTPPPATKPVVKPPVTATTTTTPGIKKTDNQTGTATPTIPVKPTTPVKPTPQPVPAPVIRIDAFTAGRSSVTAGQSATLYWKTTGATQVTLNPPGQKLAPDGSLTVTPKTTTTYTLQAGTQKRQIRITVNPAPVAKNQKVVPKITGGTSQFQRPTVKIVKFTTDHPRGIQAGSSTVLRWEVQGASTAILIPQYLSVPAISDFRVTPNRTTDYYLEAGGVTRKVTVTVIPKPASTAMGSAGKPGGVPARSCAPRRCGPAPGSARWGDPSPVVGVRRGVSRRTADACPP